MKNIKFISILFAFIALISCEEKITSPDLSKDYPRVMSTWPVAGEDGTLGVFQVNVGDTLDFGFMYTPSIAKSEWYLDGEKIGEGAEFKFVATNFGTYHLKVEVSNGGESTFREAILNVNDPSLNLDLVKSRYYVSPDQELHLNVEYTASANTNATWYLRGTIVGEGPFYTFKQSALGEYPLKVELKNPVSSLFKESVIVVRDPNVMQNIALFEDCKATASGFTSSEENPDKARDGVIDGTKWCDASSPAKWLMYEFATPVQEITKLVLNWENWDINRKYKIETSVDGNSWTEVVNITDNIQDPTEYIVSIQGTRFVKFTLMETDDAIRLMEFEVWGIR
jgi:hypothetical protein